MALLQFSDTVTNNGIVQAISRRTGTTNATSSSYPLLDKTVDVNFALANYFILANTAPGKQQPVDDSNHSDYPIIYVDLVTGQQDYVITLDEDGNQVLEILKIRVKDLNGNWRTLRQVDITDNDDSFINETGTGIPETFELTANGIFLHQPTNYNLEAGMEIYVSRAANYFVSTDTTKRAGIPEIFYEYLVIRPSYFYCLEKGEDKKANAYYRILYGPNGKGGMEAAIKSHYARRNKTIENVLTGEQVNSI